MKKIFWGLFIACSAFANDFDDAALVGHCQDGRIEFKPGEKMVFELSVKNVPDAAFTNEYTVAWTRTGDDKRTEKGSAKYIHGKPIVVETSLDIPGFVRIEAFLKDKDGKNVQRNKRWSKNVSFDGGACVQPELIRQASPEPADFDEFWARQKAKLAAVPLRYVRVPTKDAPKNLNVWDVKIDCAGARPVTGRLYIPKSASKNTPVKAVVIYNGYSTNYDAPPKDAPEGQITFRMNPHGYELGLDQKYYGDFFQSLKSNGQNFAFDKKKNTVPEDAYFNGMAMRVMRGLQFVKSLPEWNGKELIVNGGSMGGLQACWGAGLDKDVTRLETSITWNCDMGGNAIAGRVAGGWKVPWVSALDYYDPVNHVKRINKSATANISLAGVGDYVSPPSGLATLYNALPCYSKRIVFEQGSQHGYRPPEPRDTFIMENK